MLKMNATEKYTCNKPNIKNIGYITQFDNPKMNSYFMNNWLVKCILFGQG